MNIYSDRKLLTGLASAALVTWYNMFIDAIINEALIATTIVSAPIFIW